MIPGGFKPPHLGHYNLVKSYLDHPSVERVAIVIGDLERTDSSGQVSIGFDEAVRTWKEYGITEGPDITFVRARKRLNKEGQDYENPMADAYDIVQEIEPSELKAGNMVIALGASTKGGDYERAVKFAKLHQPGSKYYRDGLTVTEPPVKVRAEDNVYPAGSKHAGEPISATYMRDAIAQNDLEEFKYHMPPQILKSKSDKNLQNLLDTLAGRESFEKHDEPNYDADTSATPPLNPAALYKIAEGLDLYHLLEKVVEGDLDIEKALEEISSMAGGDVEIGVGAGKRDKKKKNPTIFRENEDEDDPRAHAVESMKEQVVDFLREKGPSSYNILTHSMMKIQPDKPVPSRSATNTAIRQLEAEHRVGRYSKPPIPVAIYYLIPEQQHLVPGADPQASFLQEDEDGGVSKEQLEVLKMQIIYYLLAWGPKQDKDIINYVTKQARGGHWEHISEDELRKSVFASFSELKREDKLAWRREVGSHGVKTNWWYLIPQHSDLLTQAGEQEEMFFQEDRGIRGKPGSNNPSTRNADDRTNEENPETGKTGNVGPKYKIAREQSEVDEVVNYLLDVGVFIG